MIKWWRPIEQYLLNSESWIYAVLLILIGHIEVQMHDVMTLEAYFYNVLLLFGVYAPLLAAFVIRDHYAFNFANAVKRTLVFYVSITAYVFLVNLINTGFEVQNLLRINESILLLAGLYVVFISFCLDIYKTYLKNRIRILFKLQQISLNKLIISVLFLISFLLSLIIVSDKENFFANKILEVAIDYPKVFSNLPLLLYVWSQIMLTYLLGYFFYYVNAHFLISQMLRKRGLIIYLFSLLGFILIFYPIIGWIINHLPLHQDVPILLPSENYEVMDPVNKAVVFGIIVISIPITLTLDWFKQNNEIISLEKQQMAIELDSLKRQINPHFFFNTLNNLYALSLAKADKAPEMILQLSELMRYVIYKGKESQVMLHEEIQYVEDYIELQQLRLPHTLSYHFKKELSSKTISIPPLLLIILVENAFKHGIEPAPDEALLDISLKSNEKQLDFICINSYEDYAHESGIGLENLRRRLDILYPNAYELILKKEANQYIAHLSLSFQ